MKQMVVDAMLNAMYDESMLLDQVNQPTGPRAAQQAWIKINRRRKQGDRFRVYILAHMTEEPWPPVKGVDDA